MSYIDDYTKLVGTSAFEGTVLWLYLDSDSPPNATTACGLLVKDLQHSQALPWYTPGAMQATEAEVAADWVRVVALPGDRAASFYRSVDGLHLTQEDIFNITQAKVVVSDNELANTYPEYKSFPDCVKMALLDMDWNLGESKLRATYIHFDAAVDAQDWAKAAAECGRNVSMKSFGPRNKWTMEQFNKAVNA